MLKLENAYYLGKILKNSGLEGYFLVSLDTTNPEEYIEMESVFVELNKNLVPFFIGDVQLISGKKARIFFEDLDEDQIKLLNGKDMFLPLSSLPELGDKNFYFFEVEGYTLIDEELGEIGIVKQVIDNPANPIIEVINKDQKEILVPKTKNTIKKISRENKELLVSLPPGLLDIYI
jgi:16S rRNA processing protein RimM